MVLVISAATASAIRLPDGFADEVVLGDLTAPTAFAFASDGRIFVAEKSGIIKVFPPGSSTPVVFADLRTQVHNAEDRGLLELKLHPSFPATPQVFVAYTLDAEMGGQPPRWGEPGETSDPCPAPEQGGCPASARLSRLQANGNQSAGETVLLENWCQHFPSHSVGGIVFDSAGALYIGAGDSASAFDIDYGQRGTPPNVCGDPPGSAGSPLSIPDSRGGALRSQNLGAASFGRATFDGKILRVDPATGAALPDNPLFGDPVEGADRIVARGLRQPFRLAVRPGTDEIWLGDVGWGRHEEINRVANPTGEVANFGWPCFEGVAPQGAFSALGLDLCEQLYDQPSNHTEPFFSYAHTEEVTPGDNCPAGTSAVTGLTFYQGSHFPEEYAGALFFADYGRGCIWVMPADGSGAPDRGGLANFASEVPSPIDIQAGPDGALYYLDIYGGELRRISYLAGNRPPTAVIEVSRRSGPLPLRVDFDGSASHDPNGDSLSYRWDFNGDGSIDSTAARPRFTYNSAGTYVVALTVSDSRGASNRAALEIFAGADIGPNPRILLPDEDLRWQVGDRIDFQGVAEDPQEGDLDPSAFHWSLVLHHCPLAGCHVHLLQDFDGVASGSFVAADHAYPSHLELKLEVTNSQGLKASTSVMLEPETADIVIESQPRGLSLAAGAESQRAPYTQTVLAGSLVTVTAPSPQRVGCRQYEFTGWSDGGARSHEVRVPQSGLRLTATFAAPVQGPCTLPCAGDCNADLEVAVDELVTAVAIAVGLQAPRLCNNADLNEDGQVTVDEIISAVNAALEGCEGGAS
ncbi:MAG TPA: PQQ-dependent sugar dehydrogenase [Terriglobales bacterium]|nr:PQQ-dependent sugar dehydrogenase [Terriglobales bacterium]